MTISTISSSTSSDLGAQVTGKKNILKKTDQFFPLPTVTSINDDNPGVHLSHHSCDESEGYEAEFFYDTLTCFDAPTTVDQTNRRVATTVSKVGTSSGKLFCCFCPRNVSKSDDSDDSVSKSSILDLVNCNFVSADLNISMDPTKMKNLELSIVDEDENDAESIGHQLETTFTTEDDFISCCDTKEFSQDDGVSLLLVDDENGSETKLKKEQVPVPTNRHIAPRPTVAIFSRYIRACDFDIYEREDAKDSTGDEDNASSSDEDQTRDLDITAHGHDSIEVSISLALTESGDMSNKLDFLELTNIHDRDPRGCHYHATFAQTMDAMVKMGLEIAAHKTNHGISPIASWKEEGATAKVLGKIQTKNADTKWYSSPKSVQKLENEVLVWSGSIVNNKPKNGQPSTPFPNYGSKIPLFKGRGIIPSITPLELTELILDSTRVKLYNKWTNGRDDLCVFQDGVNVVDGLFGNGCTKVVESRTNVPFSKNTLKMVNFLHARAAVTEHDELNDTATKNGNCYIIVSRSIYTEDEVSGARSDNITHASRGARNELIWGVNILREVPGHPNKTDLTSITQANSSAIPSFLSHKVRYFLWSFSNFVQQLIFHYISNCISVSFLLVTKRLV